MIHETDIDSTATGADTPGRQMSSDVPQPCWIALDAARELAFTGEILFDAEPEVRVYLDNGVAYYAERATDATLGRRLIDSGLVDAVQLERGIVRVGDVEHLGRLFDRVPTVDRDAVMVITEDATAALLADLANSVIAPSRATAYRHHESGVHRWFVAPASAAHLTRPVSEVAPVDNSVVEDLPGLPSGDADAFGDELRIEWDQPLIAVDDPRQTEPEVGLDDDLLAVDDARPITNSPFTEQVADVGHEALADDGFAAEDDDADPAVEPAAASSVADSPVAGPAPFAPPPAAEIPRSHDVFELSVAAEEVDHAVSTSADDGSAQPELAEPELDQAELADSELGQAESAESELAEFEFGEASPVGFESLVIDLDALVAPVDDVFDVEPHREPEIGYELELPPEPAEGAGPIEDEFFILWPNGTEERPAGGDPSTGETPALIAGEALLSRPEIEVAPEVAPAPDAAPAPETLAAPDVAPVVDDEPVVELAAAPEIVPVSDAEPVVELAAALDVAPVVDGEPVVELAAAPEIVPVSDGEPVVELAAAPDAVPSPEIAPVPELDAAPDVVRSPELAGAPGAEPPAATSPAVETEPVTVVLTPDQAATDADPNTAPDAATATPRVDFEVPATILSDLPTVDGAVPDEVSSAVLRAIRAIENASTTAPSVAPILGTESAATPPAPPAPTAEPDPAPIGFAPPTLATSAEVMYAAEREAAGEEPDVVGDAAPPAAVTPEPRVASVVFVDDDDDEPEPEDRAGALRRLISSLRRR